MNNREFTKFTGGGVLPDATTTQKGLVKLTSDTAATDNDTAATPGFVHGRMNQLISKVKTSVSVSDGVITIALTVGDNPGMIAISGYSKSGKFFTLLVAYAYSNEIVVDSNANMFTNKEIRISSGWNPVITYKCDQIAESDEFAVTAKRL